MSPLIFVAEDKEFYSNSICSGSGGPAFLITGYPDILKMLREYGINHLYQPLSYLEDNDESCSWWHGAMEWI